MSTDVKKRRTCCNHILIQSWSFCEPGWRGGWKYKKECEVVANFCCVSHKNAHSYGKLSCLPDWSCFLPLPEILITARITSLKDCTLALPFYLHHRLSCWPINMAMKNRTKGHSCLVTPHTAFRLEQNKASWCLLWNRGKKKEWRCRKGVDWERQRAREGRMGCREEEKDGSVHENRHWVSLQSIETPGEIFRETRYDSESNTQAAKLSSFPANSHLLSAL